MFQFPGNFLNRSYIPQLLLTLLFIDIEYCNAQQAVLQTQYLRYIPLTMTLCIGILPILARMFCNMHWETHRTSQVTCHSQLQILYVQDVLKER